MKNSSKLVLSDFLQKFSYIVELILENTVFFFNFIWKFTLILQNQENKPFLENLNTISKKLDEKWSRIWKYKRFHQKFFPHKNWFFNIS